jgi:hypothetical protein
MTNRLTRIIRPSYLGSCYEAKDARRTRYSGCRRKRESKAFPPFSFLAPSADTPCSEYHSSEAALKLPSLPPNSTPQVSSFSLLSPVPLSRSASPSRSPQFSSSLHLLPTKADSPSPPLSFASHPSSSLRTGHTHDLRSAVSYLHTTYPNAPLLGIGFSLGAGVMARFIGEEGESCVLKAGVVVGTPWDCPGMSARSVLPCDTSLFLPFFLSSSGRMTTGQSWLMAIRMHSLNLCFGIFVSFWMDSDDRLDATWFSRNAYSKAMGKNILKVWNGHTKNNPSSHLLQPDSRAYSRLDVRPLFPSYSSPHIHIGFLAFPPSCQPTRLLMLKIPKTLPHFYFSSRLGLILFCKQRFTANRRPLLLPSFASDGRSHRLYRRRLPRRLPL